MAIRGTPFTSETAKAANAKSNAPRSVLPKGQKRITQEERDRLMDEYDMSPLEFLLYVINNRNVEMKSRIEAAKAAAPFVHRKMPQAVEVEDKMAHVRTIVVAPEQVQDESSWNTMVKDALPPPAPTPIEQPIPMEKAEVVELKRD